MSQWLHWTRGSRVKAQTSLHTSKPSDEMKGCMWSSSCYDYKCRISSEDHEMLHRTSPCWLPAPLTPAAALPGRRCDDHRLFLRPQSPWQCPCASVSLCLCLQQQLTAAQWLSVCLSASPPAAGRQHLLLQDEPSDHLWMGQIFEG